MRYSHYAWYRRYTEDGYDGLADRKPNPKKFWNRIPAPVKEQVVAIALEKPAKSPRELAWHITDSYGYYISESSVYRILKSYDLITSQHTSSSRRQITLNIRQNKYMNYGRSTSHTSRLSAGDGTTSRQ